MTAREKIISALVATGKPMSRQDLSEATGLSVGTVQSALGRLYRSKVIDALPGEGRRNHAILYFMRAK